VLAEFRGPETYVALVTESTGVTRRMVERHESRILFGGPRDLHLWAVRLRRGFAAVERWRWEAGDDRDDEALDAAPEPLLVPLVLERDGRRQLVHERLALQTGDTLHAAVSNDRREEAEAWLRDNGFSRVEDDPPTHDAERADPPDPTRGA